MKFSEMPYKRPSLDEIRKMGEEALSKIENASCAQDVIDIYMDIEKHSEEISTMGSLSYVRYTIDTRDEFYSAENDFYDEAMPAIQEISQKTSLAMLNSKFRPELEEHFGKLLFTNLEISVRTMKSEIMDLMMEENKLQSEYQKMLANGTVEWEGDVYFVSGREMERLMDSVNFDNEESLNWFHRSLRRLGVIDALREKGAKEGDSVVIGDMEFDFVE